MFGDLQQYEALIGWLFVGSGIMFVATVLMVPAVIICLPADYFSHRKKRRAMLSHAPPLIRYPLLLLKNAFGLLLIAAGIAMLVLPGQGLLTLLAGVVLLDFPGKYQAERWAVERKVVLQTINWIRGKAGKDKLLL